MQHICHGQNLDSLKAQASSKRGGRGGVAPHQLSHGVNFWAILPNDEVPHSVACCVSMPLPSDLHLDWLGSCFDEHVLRLLGLPGLPCGFSLGHLAWHVEGALAIWQTGTCWWSPWASGRVLLKVANPCFVFRHLSSLTCWMCPLMEVAWCRPQKVEQVAATACTSSLDFSAVVSRGGAMPRDSCQGWSFPSSLVSCLGCWPWTRVGFPHDFWWHLDGSWLLQNK